MDRYLEEQIRDYLAHNVLFSPDGFQYSDDTSFIAEGLIDSMAVMELVTFVTATFGVSVGEADITPDNFDSVRNLAAFIRSKRDLRGEHVTTGLSRKE
jgi:acyl carrier protein